MTPRPRTTKASAAWAESFAIVQPSGSRYRQDVNRRIPARSDMLPPGQHEESPPEVDAPALSPIVGVETWADPACQRLDPHEREAPWCSRCDRLRHFAPP